LAVENLNNIYEISRLSRIPLRQIDPNPDFFLAISARFGHIHPRRFDDCEGLVSLRAAGRLFLASNAGQGDAAMNPLSMNTTILSFAFSGMLGAHRREYGSAPPASATPAAAPKKK
jgi:hypothetical protein